MRDSQGHPFLWSFLLYLISHFIVNNIETMKIVSILFNSITVFLILKFSPFNKIIKTGLVFSYFIFFEYTIISRNYSIGVLSIILFCVLFKNWEKNLITLALSLFLMMQGSLFSFMISISLFLYILFIFIIEREKLKKIKKIFILIFVSIFILGVIFEYWQLGSQSISFNAFSPTINDMFGKTSTEYLNSVYTVADATIKAFLPIPVFNINFWNTNLIINYINGQISFLRIVIAFILVLVPFFILKGRVLFLYSLGFILISSIPFLLYKGYTRHYGHYFILFIACLWISYDYNKNNAEVLIITKKRNIIFPKVYISFLLIISIISTVTAFYYEFKYQFSAGKSASEYLSEKYDLEKIRIIGYQDYAAEVLAGYLDKNIYYPQAENSKKYKKLVSWNNRDWDPFSIDRVIQESFQFVGEKKIILAVSDPNEEYDKILRENFFIEIYNSNNNSIVKDENFALYSFNAKFLNIYEINSNNFKNFINNQ